MSRRRRPSRPAALAAVALVAAAVAASDAPAQAPLIGPWRFEPTAGLLVDDYDIGDDGSRTGSLVGVQISRRLQGAFRGVAAVSFARVNDVGSHPPSLPRLTLANEWIFASVGPAVDLPIRRATVSLSFQAGAAWRRTTVTGQVGDPAPQPLLHDDRFSVTSVLIPAASVRFPVTWRLAILGGASAYVLSPDEGGRTSPAFMLGVALLP